MRLKDVKKKDLAWAALYVFHPNRQLGLTAGQVGGWAVFEEFYSPHSLSHTCDPISNENWSSTVEVHVRSNTAYSANFPSSVDSLMSYIRGFGFNKADSVKPIEALEGLQGQH